MKTFSKKPGKEESNYIKCPVCGSGEEKQFLLYDFCSYSFKRCRNCGLVMQNPQPVFKNISARYDAEYFDYEIANEDAFFSLMMLGLKDIGFNTLNFPLLDRREKTILDIGCATGRFLSEFKTNGWNVAGIEICKEAADYGNEKRGVNINNCTLEKAAFAAKSFSVVHASHLIEHLNDPVSFLKEIYRILKDDGYLILVTPNIDSFQNFLYRSGWRSAIADHLFLYSLKTLEKICNNNNFVLQKKGTWGGIPAGKAPSFIKKHIDSLAKALGLGDVMVMLFKKSAV